MRAVSSASHRPATSGADRDVVRLRPVVVALLAAAALVALAWGGWAALRPADAGPPAAPSPIVVPERPSPPGAGPAPATTPPAPPPGTPAPDVVPPPPVDDEDDDGADDGADDGDDDGVDDVEPDGDDD